MNGRGRTILAFDTSSRLGSVIVTANGKVLARAFLRSPRRHAARLLPAIRGVLVASGAQLGDLAGIVVGSGPGSFTGVRVAAATAKGLTEGCGVPIWTFSSLAAAAASEGVWLPAGWSGPAGWRRRQEDRAVEPPEPGTPCYVLFDARGDRVYAGCFRVGPASVDVLVPPTATRVGEVLSSSVPEGAIFAGDGAFRHAAAIAGQGWRVVPPRSDCPPPKGLPVSSRSCPGHPWTTRARGSRSTCVRGGPGLPDRDRRVAHTRIPRSERG